ncbi:MAG: sugar phosphate nucleotidyltransferase [Caulobacteraceae bacterium]
MDIQPIILCGGPGARLWPASTPAHPKPFIELAGEGSLFQQTLARMAGLVGALPPIVVAGAGHVEEVRGQLDGRPAVILAEPAGRDTAPALLAAALWSLAHHPGAVAVAVASDHFIPDHAAFGAAAMAALAAARTGEIVTFGVEPTAPSTALGYIEPGEPLGPGDRVRRVTRFVEKPDADRARAFVDAGYLWNSGNFVFRPDSLVEEAGRHVPGLLAAVRAAMPEAANAAGVVALGPEFLGATRVSIDVAIMENTARAAVLPIAYAWSDLGAWKAVWEASPHDGAGNAIRGEAVVASSQDCLIRAGSGGRVIAVGLRRIAVVVQEGDVLVCDLDDAAGLKAAVESLARSARTGT